MDVVGLDVIPIDILPDDVLLAVFECLTTTLERGIEAWQPLVHVCQRWRCIVFASPNRLDLRLVCTPKTPARNTLDVWPPLPLLIQGIPYLEEGLDGVLAVLERNNRVHEIVLTDVPISDLETFLSAMQEPFPELRHLQLKSYGGVVVPPDSFLGGSAPRLQLLRSDGIPFPGLPILLLSATHVAEINLWNTPHSGYISPEAMATALSTLTSLKDLRLGFQSPLSRPDRETRRPPPPTRSILPVLIYFHFKGDSEYLDDLVAHIDALRLRVLYITFFNDIVFDTPQLIQFICRTPRLKALEQANVTFEDDAARVKLTSRGYGNLYASVGISCKELDWQVSAVEQVCTLCLPPLSTLERLYIEEGLSSRVHWQGNVENALWLELLHPFRAVKTLYLSEEFALRIAPVLQELVGGRATEVLPSLQNIFPEVLQPSGPVREGIEKFAAMRRITSHPIRVSAWYGGAM